MRMIFTGIYFQFCHLLTSHRITGNHAFYSFLDNSFRETSVQNFACGRFFDTANPASMLIIFFISQFFAGQLYFIGVNNNNVIATIQIRREIRLMLAAQQFCDLSGQTAQYDVSCVNNVPFLVISDGLVAYVFILLVSFLKIQVKFGV